MNAESGESKFNPSDLNYRSTRNAVSLIGLENCFGLWLGLQRSKQTESFAANFLTQLLYIVHLLREYNALHASL